MTLFSVGGTGWRCAEFFPRSYRRTSYLFSSYRTTTGKYMHNTNRPVPESIFEDFDLAALIKLGGWVTPSRHCTPGQFRQTIV